MLYHEAKKEAIAIHERAAQKYNEIYEHTKWLCEKLYDTRRESVRMIGEAEELINSIAKTPKEFGEKLQMISAESEKFRATEEFAMRASEESKKMGLGAAAGVAGGAAVASMAPTAMMWVATTFGTASTGTAISSLSGAVATKAALAWLGGTERRRCWSSGWPGVISFGRSHWLGHCRDICWPDSNFPRSKE